MELLNLIIENWDEIAAAVSALVGACVTILTIVNRLIGDKVENNALGRLLALTDKFSIGTKTTEIKK